MKVLQSDTGTKMQETQKSKKATLAELTLHFCTVSRKKPKGLGEEGGCLTCEVEVEVGLTIIHRQIFDQKSALEKK